MDQVIEGLRYSTATATLLSDDKFSDGTNRLTNGRTTSLYRTESGKYFAHHETIWQGERDQTEVLDAGDARSIFESAITRHVSYEAAGFVVVDA